MPLNYADKITMVIPSYWARPKSVGHKEQDRIYDHPIPLDEQGTLKRALESLSILKDKEFNLVVLAVATGDDIAIEVEKRVKGIVDEIDSRVEIKVLSAAGEQMVQDYLRDQGCPDKYNLFRLAGYSPVRNMCLLAAHLLGSEIAIFIDDDELFEDPDFIAKSTEYIGAEFDGKEVLAVAGYYINPDDDYFLNRPVSPWMAYWNKIGTMNEAFREIISAGPRLKRTPFVFGGNMVIHKKLWLEIPFDPGVPRGEDIDFLCNAMMFGHDFYLDNRLSIKHEPPPKSHPKWQQLREDMLRFIYMRQKLVNQKKIAGMVRLKPSDFDPYPGAFIGDDIEDLIFKSNTMLGEALLAEGDKVGFAECQKNIMIGREKLKADIDPFDMLLSIKESWGSMMRALDTDSARNGLSRIFI